ncbi:MAG: DUF3857 domain-containing protein [Candidatus Aminicenantes bacterium]|nr:DUF3857 domain-containing protein [Acidobacteriota bacterium]MCG2812528.1 DUF3857 domain-containing protein [Candidatus Aminicenantes bacterium]
MKRLTLFCLAVLAACSLFALPAHDARYLKVEISYQLNADGSWDMTYKHQVRLDTYYAFNRALGETFIVYNPDFQKLEVLKSETTMADGRKVVSPENAFNEVLPFAAHGFADFSHLREMVVTHVGLERGAVVELAYRIHTRAGFLPVFSGREILAKAFPVDSYQLTIIVPAGQALRYRIFGLKAEAEVSSTAVEKRFAFPLADLRPAAHEPLQPAWAEPFIVFSNAADWGQALAMVGNSSQLPAALVERVEKLQAQNPDWIDLLAELQKAVAVEVKNCGLGPEALGWQPRRLERVAQGNYGTRLEKALLLKAMLKKAGIESDLLAIAKGSAFAPDVPTPQQLGEFWLKVADGAGAAFLDPWQEQQEFFPYFPQELDAWNLDVGEMERTLGCPWDRNTVVISGAVQLDPAAASGTLVVAVRGTFNRYNEATADSGKFITGLLKKIFPVDKVEIKKLLQLTRKEIRVEATFSGKWLKETGAGFLSVDAIRLPGLSENMVILNKRESPLALEAPFQVSLKLDLEPAAGVRIEYAAPAVERKNGLGYYSLGLVAEKNGRLRFSAAFGIKKGVVAPAEYPLLRELLMPYFTPDFWLVFKKIK